VQVLAPLTSRFASYRFILENTYVTGTVLDVDGGASIRA
jgi:hypothetical protein